MEKDHQDHQDHQIPSQFGQNFTLFLQKIDPSFQQLGEESLNKFYLNRRSIRNDDLSKEQLSEIGLQNDSQIEQALVYFLVLICCEGRLKKLLKEFSLEISKDEQTDAGFCIFKNWPRLNDESFLEEFEKRFSTKVQLREDLLKKIEQNYGNLDKEVFQKTGVKILEISVPQSQDYVQETKLQMIDWIYERIEAYEAIKDELSIMGIDEEKIPLSIQKLYRNANSDSKNSSVYSIQLIKESFEEFSKRCLEILKKTFKDFQTNRVDPKKASEFVEKLYKFIQNPDFNLFSQTFTPLKLKEIRMDKDKTLIKGLFEQIYQIQTSHEEIIQEKKMKSQDNKSYQNGKKSQLKSTNSERIQKNKNSEIKIPLDSVSEVKSQKKFSSKRKIPDNEEEDMTTAIELSQKNSTKQKEMAERRNEKIKDRLIEIDQEEARIRKDVKGQYCFELGLRELEKQILLEDHEKTAQEVKRLKALIDQYRDDESLKKYLDQILSKQTREERITLYQSFFLDTEVLNLTQILIERDRMAQDQKSGLQKVFILLGNSKVGKSTLFSALHGFILQKIQNGTVVSYEIKDKDKADPKFKISAKAMSCTKGPSITDINKKYASLGQPISMMDTGGFGDTSPLIDIINNLGTAKAAESIKKAKFILLIPKFFLDKKGALFREFAVQVQGYFKDIQKVQDSIYFIFTQGLRTQEIGDLYQSIIDTDKYKAKKFFQVFGFKFQQMLEQIEGMDEQQGERSWQIPDPVNKGYRNLLKHINKCKWFNNPGDQIKPFFSAEAKALIKRDKLKLENYTKKEYELGKYSLTLAHLQHLKELDSLDVSGTQSYKTIRTHLRTEEDRQVSRAQQNLDKFIETNNIEYFQEFEKIFELAKKRGNFSQQIYGVEKPPVKTIEEFLSQEISEGMKNWTSEEEVEDETKLMSRLKLIQKFKKKNFEKLVQEEKVKFLSIERKVKESIQSSEFIGQKLILAVKKYLNVLMIEKNLSQEERFERIKKMMEEEIAESNFEKEADLLIESGRKHILNGSLKKLSDQHIEKLNYFREVDNFRIQIYLDGLKREAIQVLNAASISYGGAIERLENDDLLNIECYFQNLNEIFKFLEKQGVKSSMIHHSKTTSISQITEKVITRAKNTSTELQNLVNSLLRNSDLDGNTQLQEIKENLMKQKNLTGVLKSLYKNNTDNDQLKKMISKLQNSIGNLCEDRIKSCKNQNITGHKINHRLFTALRIMTVATELEQDSTVKEKCQKFCKELEEKMLKPLEVEWSRSKQPMKEEPEFIQAQKLIEYLKKLHDKCDLESLNCQQFYRFFDFNSNQKVIKVIANVYNSMKNLYKEVQEKFGFSYIGQVDNKSIQENKINQTQFNKTIQYLRIFDICKQIYDDYSGHQINAIDIQQNSIKKHNLEKEMCSQLGKYSQTIDDMRNEISIQEINILKINVRNSLKIFEDSNKEQTAKKYNFLEARITQISNSLGQDWADLLKRAETYYSSISEGQDFTKLEHLVMNPDSKIPANQNKLRALFANIDRQIIKMLSQIFIATKERDATQKIEAFCSVYSFMELCKQIKYDHIFRVDMLTNNCVILFESFKKAFNQSIKLMEQGRQIIEESMVKMESQEKRTIIYLPQEYKQFLAKNNIKISLYEDFKEKKQKLQDTIRNSYLAEDFRIDAKFKTVYMHAPPQTQLMYKENYVKAGNKKVEELKTLSNSDHQAFQNQFKKFKDFLALSPQELSNEFKHTFKNIYEEKKQKDLQFETTISKQKDNKNDSSSLYSLLNKASDMNNHQIVKKAIDKIQEDTQKTIQSINFDDADKLEEQLDHFFNLKNNSQYSKSCQKFPVLSTIPQKFKKEYNKKVQAGVEQSQLSIRKDKEDKQKLFKCKQSKPISVQDLKFAPDPNIAKMKNIVEKNSKYGQQLKEQNKMVFDTVTKLNKDLNTEREKYVNMIDLLNKSIGLSKKDDSSAGTDWQSTLKMTCYIRDQSKQMADFNKWDEVTEKIDEQYTKQIDIGLNKAKQTLMKKHEDVKLNSDIRNIFLSDTQDRAKQRLQNVSSGIDTVAQFAPLLAKDDEIPHNFKEEIQQNNVVYYEENQRQSLNKVDEVYNQKVDEYGNVDQVKNHHLASKVLSNKSKLMPPNYRFSNKLEKSIKQSHALNKQTVLNFSQNESNLKYYREVSNRITENENALIEHRQTVQKWQYQEGIKQQALLEKERDTKLSQVPDNDEQKQQKRTQIIKEYKGKIENKIKDIETSANKQIKQMEEKNKRHKLKLEIEKRELASKGFIDGLVADRAGRTLFNCYQAIRADSMGTSVYLRNVEKAYGKQMIKIVYILLREKRNNFAEMIANQEKAFSDLRGLDFLELTEGIKFEDLVKLVPELKDKPDTIKDLISKFQSKFNPVYEAKLSQCKEAISLSDYTFTLAQECRDVGEKVYQSYTSNDGKDNRQTLLACIFALWTILKSTVNDEDEIIFIYRPHAGQILGLFLLLEFDQGREMKTIKSGMAQLETGQGKSVVLGGLSAYLALAKFEVYEACYSKYLSQRDYKDFKPLFEILEIDHMIHYDIFPEICRMMMDGDQKEPFPSVVQNHILNPSQWNGSFFGDFLNRWTSLKSKSGKRRSVLLVDEADVYVNEEFLGQSYYPSIKVKNQSVLKLLDYVWSFKDTATSLEPSQILKSAEFKKACDGLGHEVFTKIMENQVHDMIRGIISFNSDERSRTVKDNKIYYREGDGLSDKVHFGYKTIFAYYYEHKVKKSIDAVEFQRQLFINLIIGSFAYSKLPQMFDAILGVTGTLKSMSEKQREILQNNCQVKRLYKLPSIYSKQNRKVAFKKVESENLNKSICQSIQEEVSRKRPVIVFFKTKSEVYYFYDSDLFAPFRKESTIVTYEVSPEERDGRIQTSTFESKVTLMTIDFGRGTDFKVLSRDKNYPGLHVISSYLPESFCDYIQLVGRVARQGKNGSALIHVVQESKMSEPYIDIPLKEAEKMIYDRDNKQWETKMIEIQKRIVLSEKEHEESEKVYCGSGNIKTILENIKKLNWTAQIMKKKSRTILLIDATGSMGRVFQLIVNVILTSLPRISEIQKKESADANCEIQIAVYRNYNSPEDIILQHSGFQTNTKPLTDWMKKIHVQGGWGDQAVEVGLQFANTQKDVDQVIIIGDTPCQTKQETINRRNSNARVWNSSTKFPLTCYDDELRKLIQNKIKVHSFYLVPHYTRTFYEKLSSDTKGKCEEFKISSPQASDQFTHFISQRILENIGEKTGCLNLVEVYRKTYCQ